MCSELERAKQIIETRYECLKQAFKTEFVRELEGDSLESCFYYPQNLKDILRWNRDAVSVDDLIDLAGYNEHTIGDLGGAEVVFLGNNPGSAGVFGADQNGEMQKIRQSVGYLRQYPALFNQFYPIANSALMVFKPWFVSRLRNLLNRFLQGNPDICRFAPYIASAELSPYHTRYFRNNALQRLTQQQNAEVYKKVGASMERGAVLIALYVGAKNGWIEQIPALATYENSYFCHNRPRFAPRLLGELERIDNPGVSAYGEVVDKLEKRFRRLGLV